MSSESRVNFSSEVRLSAHCSWHKMKNTPFRKAEGNQKHAPVDSANHLKSDEEQQRSDPMDPVIFTRRLKLTLVTKAERGSPELEWFHELRSNEKATWWR